MTSERRITNKKRELFVLSHTFNKYSIIAVVIGWSEQMT